MPIPQRLAAELETAKSLITQDGELPAAVRKRILQLMEELSESEHANAGYLRRTRLALICAHEVVARVSPYTDVLASARVMLENGAAALAGQYDLAALQKDNGNFHTKVIDLFEHGEIAYAPVYAGMACFAATSTVLYDTNFELVGENEKSVSPDDWDVSFYASLAVAGSAIWEAKGGAENRRSYWLWYLGNAIPSAWDIQDPLAFA